MHLKQHTVTPMQHGCSECRAEEDSIIDSARCCRKVVVAVFSIILFADGGSKLLYIVTQWLFLIFS